MSTPLPPSTGQPATAAPAPDATSNTPSSSQQYNSENYYGTPTLLHVGSVGSAILAPIGLMLPPRRIGGRTILLTAGFFIATNQLSYDYTGQSIYQRFKKRMGQFSAYQAEELPPAALQRQAAMRAERERRRQLEEAGASAGPAPDKDSRLHRLWMGNEKEDWVKERARKEKETLESGGGYWDLIMNQIGEVASDLANKGKKADEGKPGEGTEAAPKPENAKK